MKPQYFFIVLLITILSCYKNPDLKVKTYFCIHAQKITYFDIQPPTFKWGKCYQTNTFSRGEYAKLKEKLNIDPRIYRNFHVQLNARDFYPYVRIK